MEWKISEESKADMNKPLTSVIPDFKGQAINVVVQSFHTFKKDICFDGIFRMDLDKILELMKCTSCERLVFPSSNNEVKICTAGHLFCNQPRCGPRCVLQGPSGRHCLNNIEPHRFEFYSQLYYSPIFRCKFISSGCPMVLTGSQLVQHERSCEYNPVFSCQYQDCPLKYWNLILPHLIDHMKKEHDTIVTDFSSKSVQIPMPFDITRNLKWKGSEEFVPAIFRCGDHDLALSMRRQDDDIHFSVRLLNPDLRQSDLRVQCRIKSNYKAWMTWNENPPQPFSSSPPSVDPPEAGFSVQNLEFMRMCMNKGEGDGAKDFFIFEIE